MNYGRCMTLSALEKVKHTEHEMVDRSCAIDHREECPYTHAEHQTCESQRDLVVE